MLPAKLRSHSVRGRHTTGGTPAAITIAAAKSAARPARASATTCQSQVPCKARASAPMQANARALHNIQK